MTEQGRAYCSGLFGGTRARAMPTNYHYFAIKIVSSLEDKRDIDKTRNWPSVNNG